MVNGRLAGLGGVQDLKSRHGSGFIVEVKTSDEGLVPVITESLLADYKRARTTASYGGVIKFEIEGDVLLSEFFAKMQTRRAAWKVVDYSISQVTLEQVFMRFARKQL